MISPHRRLSTAVFGYVAACGLFCLSLGALPACSGTYKGGDGEVGSSDVAAAEVDGSAAPCDSACPVDESCVDGACVEDCFDPQDCPPDAQPTDGGPTDTDPTDGGPTDTDPTDGGPTDTDPTDSGPTDPGLDTTDSGASPGDEGGSLPDLSQDAQVGDSTEPAEVQGDTGNVGEDSPSIPDDSCGPGIPCDDGAPCIPTDAGYACATSCADDPCPEGWSCDSGDLYCVSAAINLCQPCLLDADCLEGGGTAGDLCVPLSGGEGSFCGTGCETDSDCPDGYSCYVTLTGGPGEFTHLCRPDAGTCECNWWGIAKEAETTCGEGVCTATRACEAGGLAECEAPLAQTEICDQEDNDCDGEVDEDFPSAVLEFACDGADEDLCFGGTWVCDPASPAGVACSENIDPGGLASQDELCDTEDNDCDGAVDEDFPDLGEICDGIDADSCANGVWICTEDQRDLICDEEGEGFAEICDGLDNDCDDEIDEDDVCGGTPFGVSGVVVIDGLTLQVSRTMNQGETWEELGVVGGLPTPTIPAVTTGPLAVIYVGVFVSSTFAGEQGLPTGVNVARSDDGGFTWSIVGGWEGELKQAVTLCADPITGELYGTNQSGSVVLSVDQGVTFDVVGFIETGSPSLDCVVTPDGDVLILEANYCGDITEDPCSTLWRSTDGGVTFTEAGQAIANGQGGTKSAMTVAPGGYLYAVGGQNEVYISDGVDLTAWTLAGVVDTGSPKEIQTIAAGEDGALYAATPTSACAGSGCDPATVGGHFFFSADHGATWSKGAVDWTPGGSGSGWVGLVVSKYPPTP